MAEQTIERRQEITSRRAVVKSRKETLPSVDTAEALRQAKHCLEGSDRRLRRGDAGQADEILRLLQSATDLLEAALITPVATD